MIQNKNARALDMSTFVNIIASSGEEHILNTDYGRVYIQKVGATDRHYQQLHPVKLINIEDVTDDYNGTNISIISLKKVYRVDYICYISESQLLRTNDSNKKRRIRIFLAIYVYAALLAASINREASETMVDAITMCLSDTWSTYEEEENESADYLMKDYILMLLEEHHVPAAPMLLKSSVEYVVKREDEALRYLEKVVKAFPLKKMMKEDREEYLINIFSWFEKTK